jgi:hypothetical protein
LRENLIIFILTQIVAQSSNKALLASYFHLVSLHNILNAKSYDAGGHSHQRTCLDDDDERRLKKRRVGCWVQDRRAGLERLEESADVSTKRKVIPEEHLLVIRKEVGERTRFTNKI